MTQADGSPSAEQASDVTVQGAGWLTFGGADLDLLMAGAWSADIEVARAAVALAEAQVHQMQEEWARLTVRALVDAEVLQVNYHRLQGGGFGRVG
jgi:hypothetical protein